MSEKSISIGGNVGRDVNIVDGDQTFGDKSMVGDDSIDAGVVTQGDSNTVDAAGQQVTNAVDSLKEITDYFNQLKQVIGKEPELDEVKPKNNLPEIPERLLTAARANATTFESARDEQLREVEYWTDEQAIDAWHQQATVPEEEVDRTFLGAIFHRLKTIAPKILRGSLAAGEAYLQSKIKTSSIIAAGIAFLGTLKDDM